jgi:hypothetical protein
MGDACRCFRSAPLVKSCAEASAAALARCRPVRAPFVAGSPGGGFLGLVGAPRLFFVDPGSAKSSLQHISDVRERQIA